MRPFLFCLMVIGPALLGAAVQPLRAEWVPVRDTTLVVPQGSPLDFSNFGPLRPAGQDGRVVANADGQLALASRPDQRVRFLCASLAWSSASGSYPDHTTADLYAAQLRLHGYNMARFHFTDLMLMTGRARDFDYDPEQLDRFRYLLAALKRQGIYWIIDAMTSQEGALGDASPDRWMEKGDLKLAVHVDPAARRHWSRLVETLYDSVNPYTGLAPLKDPTLALVVLVNENGVEFTAMLNYSRLRRAYPAKLQPWFDRWLAAKYGTTAGLRAAWPDLGAGESLERGSVEFPNSWDARGPRMFDTQSFIRSVEANTTAWMSAEIRRLGYPGLLSMYNNQTHTALSFSREPLPAVAMDTYFDEVLSFEPGATISQKSSLDDSVRYLRNIMGARWLGRPFVVTEWNHVFWNRFRHEGGIAVPAYAALQGWDAICQHGAGAIDLSFDEPYPHKRAILPYGVGLDPIARASETLAALLFRRGDVAPAPHTVAVPFGAPGDMLGDGRDNLPDRVTALGLLTRLGLSPRGTGARSRSETLTLPLSEAQGQKEAKSAGRLDLADNIGRLRAAGALDHGNPTDPGQGIYESETGQILLDTRAELLSAVTPRTEAVSFTALAGPRRLAALTIQSASGPAMVAISALDGAPIRTSRRLLLIVATDAMNTDMMFKDAAHRTIESFGHMPVLIERATVHMSVAVDAPRRWRLSSLHLNGSPGDTLPLKAGHTELEITLDNASPSHGPTTFFLLERKD